MHLSLPLQNHLLFRLLAVASALAWLAILTSTARAQSFVYETKLEFITTGDFNSDGQADVLFVNKAKGRVRIGYMLGGGIFDWPDWRESGLKSASGISVGKLFDAQRDSIAVVSFDENKLAVVDAPSPTVPSEPVVIPVNAVGPNLVLALDIPGAGNTPLADLMMPSTLNPEDNPNKYTLFRNTAGKFTQLSESATPASGARANVVTLKPGGGELAAAILTDDSGTRLVVGSLASGQPQPVFALTNVPAGADYVIGNFRGAATRDFVLYTPGSPEILFCPVEIKGDSYEAGPAKSFTPAKPVNLLVTVPGQGRSRLLGLFGEQEPAELLEFDGAKPPEKLQELAGTPETFLKSAVALPDCLLLCSTVTPSNSLLSHYQAYILKDGKFAEGSYGKLPTLDDRDESTVPAIHARIVANLKEKTPADMAGYTNVIPGTGVAYSMVAIPGGEFLMGSPANEPGRKPAEGPQHRVKVSPFWMGQFEVTWDQYQLYMFPDDEKAQRLQYATNAEVNPVSDAVTRPTKPYVDMSFGMGKAGYPAIAMTQHAANKFCHWLSARTGHFYRLPTEAEWEYACRAGTTTAYSFGDDPEKLTDYAWYFDNANDKYQPVGKKKPNPWGLFDIHGNVREWTLDQFDEAYYASLAAKTVVADPWNKASKPYPHTSRGGSWEDDPDALRSAARIPSSKAWKMTDPQLPKSRWWLTDAKWIGIRVVRPLAVPPPEEMVKYWTSGVDKE
jgi:formylglycine-generating enzyme required for sulfatase activity